MKPINFIPVLILAFLLSFTSKSSAPLDKQPAAKAVEHERWERKTTIAKNARWRFATASEIMSLENVPGAIQKDKDYDAKFYENKMGIRHLMEGQIITIKKCYIHLVGDESDNDYHIQINDSKSNITKCMIIEILEGKQVANKTMAKKFDALRAKLLPYLNKTTVKLNII